MGTYTISGNTTGAPRFATVNDNGTQREIAYLTVIEQKQVKRDGQWVDGTAVSFEVSIRNRAIIDAIKRANLTESVPVVVTGDLGFKEDGFKVGSDGQLIQRKQADANGQPQYVRAYTPHIYADSIGAEFLFTAIQVQRVKKDQAAAVQPQFAVPAAPAAQPVAAAPSAPQAAAAPFAAPAAAPAAPAQAAPAMTEPPF